MQISGHAALVTGAASGLGEAPARGLARPGKPEQVAELPCHEVAYGQVDGEMICLDGALRVAPG